MAHPATHLDATLRPPRSLSDAARRLVLLMLAAAFCILGIGFLAAGAYPIVGFMGAEVLLLWYLLRRFSQSRAPWTQLRVTTETVEVVRHGPAGRGSREWVPSYFARVIHDASARGAHALRVSAGRRSLIIGEHLSASEQSSLAQRLETALNSARRERYSSEGG